MDEPISIENLVAHVMSKGDVYDLEHHKLKIHKSVNPVAASAKHD
jgi:hypothetical protein